MTRSCSRNRVLMVAFHVPPFGSSSGVQRTLRFIQYLPQYGWDPVLLAPNPRVYRERSDDLLNQIPAATPVYRAFALDAAKHLAFRGRYLHWMCFPDRFATWLAGAIPAGMMLIKRYRPAAIWTTYPVATAHVIGYALARLSGLPWVADFRDPMLYEAWPEEPFARRAAAWAERLTVCRCARAVVVTESALQLYRERYANLPSERFTMIANGYDETAFEGIASAGPSVNEPLLLLHAGLLEPVDRDPADLFEAIAALKRNRLISSDSLRVILRASGFDDRYGAQINALQIDDIVSLAPALPYKQALAEMAAASGLILLQGPTCNRQIPAKLYEYMRAGPPIFAITDAAGDTFRLLQSMGVVDIAQFGSRESIATELARFVTAIPNGSAARVPLSTMHRYDRRTLTAELARVFDQCTSARNVPVQ